MDLDELTPTDKPKAFTPLHPQTGAEITRNGEPTVFHLWGPDSAKMQAFERKLNQRRLTVASRTGKVQITAEAIEDEGIERAVEMIHDWENVGVSGLDLPYSAVAARDLVTKWAWLKDQFDEQYRNRGNFLEAAAVPSSTK